MKKIFLFSALAFLFVFFSCQKEEVQETEPLITDKYESLIKSISESDNYHEWSVYMFGTLQMGILELNRQPLMEIQNFEEMANKGENLTQKELSSILKVYGFSSKTELATFMESLANRQKLVYEEFPKLKELSPEEVGQIMGKAFESCDACIRDVLGFDAKTGTLLDDMPEGSIFQIFECSSENVSVVNFPGDPAIVACCMNWDELEAEYTACANIAIGGAYVGAVGCAGAAATIFGEVSAANITFGAAGPVGIAIAGGISILAGGSSLAVCLYGVNTVFNSACFQCRQNISNKCDYQEC